MQRVYKPFHCLYCVAKKERLNSHPSSAINFNLMRSSCKGLARFFVSCYKVIKILSNGRDQASLLAALSIIVIIICFCNFLPILVNPLGTMIRMQQKVLGSQRIHRFCMMINREVMGNVVVPGGAIILLRRHVLKTFVVLWPG